MERTVNYSEMVRSNGGCGFIKERQKPVIMGVRAISKNMKP